MKKDKIMETKWIQIAVLDYNGGTVVRYDEEFPTDETGNVQTEEIEKYLFEKCGYNEDEISYMFSEEIEWYV